VHGESYITVLSGEVGRLVVSQNHIDTMEEKKGMARKRKKDCHWLFCWLAGGRGYESNL